MTVEVTMPRLSDSMEEGTVAKWLVDVGAEVGKGQPLVEIDTDKATMEYEAEVPGVLLEIVVPEGGTAPIGATIARIGAAGEAPTAPDPPAAKTRTSASPIAKRLARELGVDLDGLTGTGPGGMITKEDIEGAAGGAKAAPSEIEPLTRVQRAVARHMEAAAAVPTFAVEVEIDMTACAALRETFDSRPSYNDLVVKACALALREQLRVNSAYSDAGFRPSERVNVGIAVAAEDALYVPVVHDADTKPLAEIGRASRELAEKARAGTLAPADLEGGTFTVSNLGTHGVRRFEALLNTPQAAILAVGGVEQRPAVGADGSLTVLPLLSATLVCDHRILYGADGAAFLARLRELLESPEPLASS